MSLKLSVIIPCFNEEKRFQKGFDHYYSYLKKQKFQWELILVNDGSTDKTLDLMKKVKHGKLQIKVISYGKNKGKGFAITKGVQNSKGQYILFSDLDHSVSIETIENFFDYFKKGFSIVIASRRVNGAQIAVHQNGLREFLGRGFTALVRLIIDPHIKDATCGFKAFETNIANKIFSKISIYDWAFDAEIIFIAQKMKSKLAQAPVVWTDVRGSKVSLKKDILRSLFGLIKIRLNDLQGKYS